MLRRLALVAVVVMLVLAGIGQVYSVRASAIEMNDALDAAPSETLPTKMQATFGGVVFEDVNGNGRRDPGERGVAGALVEVTSVPVNQGPNPISGSLTVMTDETGAYSSTLFPNYIYTVTVQADPTQWTPTTPTRTQFRSTAAPGSFNVGLRGRATK